MSKSISSQCVNTIRFLSADAVQQANSGHPSAPMGLADVAFVLWSQFLQFTPEHPKWANRDRVVLSVGHASMLLYSMLHLCGYDLSLEEIKQFRQWNSKTPGHPEYGETDGVECTTGPLGAGFGNAVGMALGSKMMGARFNREEQSVIDHFTYVLCGDGDMQEGITAESASFAGHLGLGNLIAIYDANQITIAGKLNLSMSEDVGKRFEAYGWHIQSCDGHDHSAIANCIQNAQAQVNQPSLIIARTIIGKGSPHRQGTAGVHGSPLGEEELKLAKENLGWPTEPRFLIPDEVSQYFAELVASKKESYQIWQKKFEQWKQSNPENFEQWQQYWTTNPSENLLSTLIDCTQLKEDATRSLSGMIIQKVTELLPNLIGGSADLEPSTKTLIQNSASILPSTANSHQVSDPSFIGKNIHFGIREHAMGAIANGLMFFGGWKVYCATFAVFSDYMRTSIRLAALSKIPTIFIFTHDSYAVGEDGPTHQPIEQTWALRLIPNLDVWRPADAMETAVAWASALSKSNATTPSALLLTRQKVKNLVRSQSFDPTIILKGGYVTREANEFPPQLILISTGSESSAAQEAQQLLEERGIATRHVSMPCVEKFLAQSAEYQKEVLPKGILTVAIEAGSTMPWYRFADFVIGRDEFGQSAPYAKLNEEFGLSATQLTSTIQEWYQQHV